MKKMIKEEYNELLRELRFKKERDGDDQYLNEILDKSDILFEKIEDVNLLKIDAKIRSESTRLSNQCLEKQIKGNFTVNDFINFMKKPEFNEFCRKIAENYIGIDFFVPCSLVPKESITRKKSEKITESQAIEPNKIEKIDEDEAVVYIDKIVASISENVNFYKLVLDPNSFSKTVENIFYTSFAIKLKKLFVFQDNSGNILVTKINPNKGKNNDDSHLIFDIEFNEYKKLIENLKIHEAFIK
ncbi:Non-structural maintenance of chromosome element 4 [Dictyocoela muelleri]|nr:Non-structural maintenance of chromosome element 4 [Dictyocoela muelleri]